MEYSVRVTIQVEHHDKVGCADDLTVSFADFIGAKSPADAASRVAKTVPGLVAERLELSTPLDGVLDRIGDVVKEAE